ncbi:hypothetical protein ALP83_200117 [Pseudomonas syringae pv. actinidiae]|uniref:Uncharacterized protein n=1 Tax=Pseudomonas syringae pv. actinidiae TaxID=103796 RepID=A0A7Z6UIC3_PSESF|nr:hypothetical protein ALP83_200117 [Pseudomonas syringae pv. actinidiae]
MACPVSDLPACGFDQLVQRVVTVTADRFDKLVVAIPVWLGRIGDEQDIAHRVIAVIELLQQRAVSRGRAQPGQPAVLLIIGIKAGDAIACCFLFNLIEGVVVNGTDQCLRVRAAVQHQICAVRLSGYVISGELGITLGVGLRKRFALCVERPTGL